MAIAMKNPPRTGLAPFLTMVLTMGLAMGLATGTAQAQTRSDGLRAPKTVELNFRDADILSVLDFYSQLLDKNIIPGGEVQGTVTIISPKPVPVAEARRLLYSVLDVKGYSVVEQSDFYKVVRKGTATHEGLRSNWEAGSDRMFTDVIHLKYAQAEAIAGDIRRILSPEADLFASKHLNYLVITDTGGNIAKVHRLIEKIDQAGVLPDTRTWHLEYARAEDVAQVLAKAFPEEGLKMNKAQVIPVKATNDLVVTAVPETIERMDRTIRSLDVRTRQVSISAMLVEVTLDKDTKLGVEWQKYLALGQGWRGNIAQDLGHVLALPSTGVGAYSDNALKASLLRSDDFSLLLHYLAADSKARVISSPHIMAMDNQKATISVGQEIPILKESRLDSNNQPIKTYDHMKFGMEMEITPSIARNRDVTLKVIQKLSNLLNPDTTTPDQWKSSDRSASTTVVVKDRYTLVIGGLMADDSLVSSSGVPGLKSLPGVGFLFGQSQDKSTKTELLLFLTPHVVETPDEHERLTQAKKEQTPGLMDMAGMEFDL